MFNTVILYHYTIKFNNDYTRYNICSAWFLDIRISTCYCVTMYVNLSVSVCLCVHAHMRVYMYMNI